MHITNQKERFKKLLHGIQTVVSGSIPDQIEVGETEDDVLPLEVGFNLLVKDLKQLQQENEQRLNELKSKAADHNNMVAQIKSTIQEMEDILQSREERRSKEARIASKVEQLKSQLKK
jgi:hypothetical protein